MAKLKTRCKKSFTMLELLIAVAIFTTFMAAVSIMTNKKENKLFLDECEKIRHFICESIEVASSSRTSFSITVNIVHEADHSAKTVIIGHKNGGLEKYEFLYLKFADINIQDKCIFDGVSFTMTPALTWKIWKPSDKNIFKTLTISGKGYCTLE